MAKGFDVAEGRFERTAPLLKQNQIEEMVGERERLSATLKAPPHLRNAIQDAGTMMATLKRLERSLERDTPRQYQGSGVDAAIKREKELREKFTQGMPTREEMRRNPPGALEKHMQWEARNKADISEWKNIRRRLLASGAMSEDLSDSSVANIERYRPAGGAGELSMDGAQIPKTTTYHGLGGRSSVFSEDDLAKLEMYAPKLKAALALLSAEERDEVKAALDTHFSPDASTFDGLTYKDARERCKAVGLETGGALADLIDRLKAHYVKGS